MADSDHNKANQLSGPFGSLREYLEAVDHLGQVLHVDKVDQDAYEATGFMYQLIDKVGWSEAPVVSFNHIKTGGRWMDGPVIGNPWGRWQYEPLAFGVDAHGYDQRQLYKSTLEQLETLVDKDGQWPALEPTEVSRQNAPCKEVTLLDDAIDLLQFPFIKTNPADGGAYINTGNVILEAPEYGRNVGTYRCQVKGPRKISVNPERNQHGWTFLMDMKDRGEPFARAAVVIGADPIVFAMSSSKTTRLGQDELKVAGGFLGRPVEVVKCETSELRVPANVEMVIEGEIPFDFEPEGPFGEMYGYIGEYKPENFYMNVTAVTHRKNPIFINNFTGIHRGFLTAPLEMTSNLNYRQRFPNVLSVHFPLQTPGYCFIRIRKTRADDAITIGREIATSLKIAKIAIVVDEDVDVHNFTEVMHTVGARWQPHQATEIIEKAGAMGGDPSSPTRGSGSRVVIDATRKGPDEGGPEVYARMNRECLLAEKPDILSHINNKWGDLINNWKS